MTLHEDPIVRLFTEVQEITPQPRDYLELAALSESRGITDRVAQEQYNCSDVFELARKLYATYLETGMPEASCMAAPVPRKSLFRRISMFLRFYLRGAMFVMPMLVSILSVLMFRFSLWSYMDFSVDFATAIALGTVLSFLVTGGFTQAIGRRGLIYLVQNEFGMARRFVFWAIRAGIVATVVVALTLIFSNVLVVLLPWSMTWMIVEYFFFLSLIWLSIAALYMLQEEVIFTVIVMAGIGVVGLMFYVFQKDMVFSQIVGLSFSAIASTIAAAWKFHTRSLKEEKAYKVTSFPRLPILLHTLAPYFAYGFLYFAFLYVDRLMAWSSNNPDQMPYPIWFRGEYELGMDWGLFALLLPMGLVEWYINSFVNDIIPNGKAYGLDEEKKYNRHYINHYQDNMGTFSLIALVSGLLVYFGLLALEDANWVNLGISASKTTLFVFTWAVVGYVFVCASLLNCLYLFTLSRPQPVLRAVILALVTNFIVGFILSRTVDYSWAVFGLVSGGLVFVVVSTREAWKLFSNLAYYYYAAL